MSPPSTSLLGCRISTPSHHLYIHTPLGHGAYGHIYLATSSAATLYCIKYLEDAHLSEAQKAIQRREAEIQGVLSLSRHPGILRLEHILDPLVVDDTVFPGWCMVLEYCNGGDLFDFVVNGQLASYGRQASEIARDIFMQTCEAVLRMHEMGVAHRDLKGENVFLKWEQVISGMGRWRVKVGDFGLACYVQHRRPSTTSDRHRQHHHHHHHRRNSSITSMVSDATVKSRIESGKGCGSDFYMSPETRVSFPTPLDPLTHQPVVYDPQTADVWALGILLCNLATRRNPWHKASARDAGFRLYLQSPTPRTLRTLVPRLRADVSVVVARILRLEPKQRPKLAEIKEWVAGLMPGWCCYEDDGVEDESEEEEVVMEEEMVSVERRPWIETGTLTSWTTPSTVAASIRTPASGSFGYDEARRAHADSWVRQNNVRDDAATVSFSEAATVSFFSEVSTIPCSSESVPPWTPTTQVDRVSFDEDEDVMMLAPSKASSMTRGASEIAPSVVKVECEPSTSKTDASWLGRGWHFRGSGSDAERRASQEREQQQLSALPTPRKERGKQGLAHSSGGGLMEKLWPASWRKKG